MKRTTTLLLFLLMIGVHFPWAPSSNALIGGGLKGGINIADIGANPAFDFEKRTGMFIGLYLEIGLDPLYLQPELNYVQKGATIPGGGTYAFDYLEIPAFIKYKFDLPFINIALMAGPYLAFKLNADLSGIEIANASGSDFGFDIGTGLELPLGPLGLFLDLRYSVGLSNILDSTTVTWKNRGMKIIGGLSLGI